MDFRVLGPLEASDGGREVALGGVKQRSLLAILLQHPNAIASTDHLQAELYGVWSPDGREIAFVQLNSGSGNDIYTIRPDGSHPRAVINTAGDEASPDWSPDGKRIVFFADPTQPYGDWDVYVTRRDGGSPPTRLTTTGGYTPVWSPDGRQNLFSNNELFTMRAEGSRPRAVLPESFDGHHPDWQPVPKNWRAEDDD